MEKDKDEQQQHRNEREGSPDVPPAVEHVQLRLASRQKRTPHISDDVHVLSHKRCNWCPDAKLVRTCRVT